MKRIVEVEQMQVEQMYEKSLRPSDFEGYIGQEKIKSNLKIFIQAALNRNESLDHCLFYGPAGLGKTTLASIIAKSMGANIKTTAAPMIEKSGDLAALLTNLEEGDVFFIDEIHRLSPAVEEILYPAMEDYRLDIVIGQGPAAQTVKIDLPRFTLIGATTKSAGISTPLRDRFGISFRLEFYKDSELAQIVEFAAIKLGIACSREGAMEIAKRARSTPRIALRLLKRVRDFAQVAGESSISQKRANEALGELGVNELGFDEMDLSYLRLLCSAKRALGLNTLAAALSEDEATIEDVLEPFLLANGYIERSAKGRLATNKAYSFLKLKPLGAESLFEG